MGDVVRIDAAGEFPGDSEQFSEKAFGHSLYRNAFDHGYSQQLEELSGFMEHYPHDRHHLLPVIEEAIVEERYAFALYALEFRRRQVGDEWSVESRDRTEVANQAVKIAALASLQHDEKTRDLAEQLLRLAEDRP